MNNKNNTLRNIEAAHPGNGHPVSSRPCAEGAGLSRQVFAITGLALCMGLASCAAPHVTHGDGSLAFSGYRPGYTVDSLPRGYRSETISGSTYHYNDGSYYRQDTGGYVIVEAPRSSRYYDDYSRYQRSRQPTRGYRGSSARQDQRFERGETVRRLPDNYRVVNHRGNTYYQTGDRFYQQQGESFIIVGSPY